MFGDLFFDSFYFGTAFFGGTPTVVTPMKLRQIGGSESGFDTLDGGSAEIRYAVLNSDDVPAMRNAVLSVLPSTYEALRLDKLSRDWDEEGDYWIWTGEYNYRAPEALLRWGFSTQGGTIRLTQSKLTTRYPAAAPNFNGGIGFSNGEMQGVDIVIPTMKLQATYRWPKNTFTTAHANILAAMTGTINSAPWQGYAAGELLYLGSTGDIVPGLPTEVTYEFAASANASGLSIGSIAGITKAGHDYLWVLYEDDEDTAAKKLVKKPLAAYVERVYTPVAFTALGIG